MAKFHVLAHISTRESADPAEPGYERWLDFEPGDKTELPAHVDVERLIASGHLEPLTEKRPKKAKRGAK